MNLVTVASARLQRGRIQPSRRDAQRRIDLQRVAGHAARIEQDGVPTQHRQPRCGGRACSEVRAGRGREKIEIDVERRRAGRDIDVECEHLHRIAQPCHSLSVRGDAQSGQSIDRPGRPMLARNPFRIEQRHRSRHRRNVEMRVIDVRSDVRRINPQRDRRGGEREGEEEQRQDKRNAFHDAAS